MNLPNKLTILRIIMVPFFVFFMLAEIEKMKAAAPGLLGQ